jgi:hypothetical protein
VRFAFFSAALYLFTNKVIAAIIAVIAATIKVTCHIAMEAAVPAAVAVVPNNVAPTLAVPKAGAIAMIAGINIPIPEIKAIIFYPVVASLSLNTSIIPCTVENAYPIAITALVALEKASAIGIGFFIVLSISTF